MLFLNEHVSITKWRMKWRKPLKKNSRQELNYSVEEMLLFACDPIYPSPVFENVILGAALKNAVLPTTIMEKLNELNRAIDCSEPLGFSVNQHLAVIAWSGLFSMRFILSSSTGWPRKTMPWWSASSNWGSPLHWGRCSCSCSKRLHCPRRRCNGLPFSALAWSAAHTASLSSRLPNATRQRKKSASFFPSNRFSPPSCLSFSCMKSSKYRLTSVLRWFWQPWFLRYYQRNPHNKVINFIFPRHITWIT